MIIRKIIRHGGALAVTIPASWCRDLDFNRGDYVAAAVGVNGEITMAKLTEAQVETLRPKIIQLEDD